MNALLRLFPLKTLLLAVATLMLGRKDEIIKQTQEWIGTAQQTIEGGPAKFKWVKARVALLAPDKTGVWVDTAIQALVAYVRLKAGK